MTWAEAFAIAVGCISLAAVLIAMIGGFGGHKTIYHVPPKKRDDFFDEIPSFRYEKHLTTTKPLWTETRRPTFTSAKTDAKTQEKDLDTKV